MAGRRSQPILETPRLILRPFSAADAPAVRTLAGAHELARTTLSVPHPYEDGMAEAWIGTHAAGFAAGMRGDYAKAEELLNRALKVKTEYYARASENLKIVRALAAQDGPDLARHAVP